MSKMPWYRWTCDRCGVATGDGPSPPSGWATAYERCTVPNRSSSGAPIIGPGVPGRREVNICPACPEEIPECAPEAHDWGRPYFAGLGRLEEACRTCGLERSAEGKR